MRVLLAALIATTAMVASVLADDAELAPIVRPPVAASAAVREALRAAGKFEVYDGLPHPMSARDLYEAELKRLQPDERHVIDGQDLYLPATTVRDHEALRDLLTADETYIVYAGPKRCGGFHADYAVTWRVEDVDYYVLICFGCHEIRFSDGTTTTMHDIASDSLQPLARELSRYGIDPPPRRPTPDEKYPPGTLEEL